jgi:hypothetical protein
VCIGETRNGRRLQNTYTRNEILRRKRQVAKVNWALILERLGVHEAFGATQQNVAVYMTLYKILLKGPKDTSVY